MEEISALIPFDFAKELQKFTEATALALRQAKEKNDASSKEYSVKDLRTMADKTKRNQIEACKLIEKTNLTTKAVVDYKQGQAKLQAEQVEGKKISWLQRVHEQQQKRDQLMAKLQERREFFNSL